MANKNVPKSLSITVCYLAAKLTGLVHKLHNTKITRYPRSITFYAALPMRSQNHGVRGSWDWVTVHPGGMKMIQLLSFSL